MDAVRALRLLGRYTADQWGLVTTRQADLVGVDRVTLHRLREVGLLQPVRRGVHAMSAASPDNARAERAVWLSLRPDVAGWERPELDPDGGVASHQSALRLHGLGDLARTHVEFIVPRRRSSRDPDVRLHRARLTADDVVVVDGIPVTTVVRTVGDLLDRYTDESHVATVVRQALETGRAGTAQLLDVLAPYARRYGVHPRTGQALLDHLLGQDTSPLARAVMRNSGARWEELATKPITWGELAALTTDPSIRRLLSEGNGS